MAFFGGFRLFSFLPFSLLFLFLFTSIYGTIPLGTFFSRDTEQEHIGWLYIWPYTGQYRNDFFSSHHLTFRELRLQFLQDFFHS
jgi:hypothetical protein